jgi:heterodisulfide reductase subunit D
LQIVNLATLPKFKAELQLNELEAARAAGVDELVAVYHSDHRELCAHERDWPFKIMKIGESKEGPLQESEDQAGRDCEWG